MVEDIGVLLGEAFVADVLWTGQKLQLKSSEVSC